ncbi:hypothetical protein L226DRAFT_485780 [Lentinus tigrinus ALCF2SS1-7]|uniref:uncharacterized protein n=1 Tax=Lentinus tigrinus ALCF2SS1-7 TaxID=1328758 RepID=UPI001165C92C|nr:hypothetical protein L226DRAFT_485780 [Lentinus tigrinus ALCF2SS1-7]
MWLLDTHTFKLHWCHNPEKECYAILSHVWNRAGEQTFQDLRQIHADINESPASHRAPETQPSLWNDVRFSVKLRCFCALARNHGYRYGWLDACCIDKTSSAELSEAINSMYEWYLRSDICFALLYDVDEADDPYAQRSSFRKSEWFKRGWTLQELIAPREVVFCSRNWCPLGTKRSLGSVIEQATGIDTAILLHEQSLESVSVARKMSWASFRKTTRVEDEAYSLMGLFGIYMPTIYGEGSNAFLRLQEEIIQRIPDQSIFAWGCRTLQDEASSSGRAPMVAADLSHSPSLLAPSPASFSYSQHFTCISFQDLGKLIGRPHLGPTENSITSHGVRMRVPLIPFPLDMQVANGDSYVLALLACLDENARIVALVLSRGTQDNDQYHVTQLTSGLAKFRCVTLSLVGWSNSSLQVTDVYLSYARRTLQSSELDSPLTRFHLSLDTHPQAQCLLFLTPWAAARLAKSSFFSSVDVARPMIIADGCADSATLWSHSDNRLFYIHVRAQTSCPRPESPDNAGTLHTYISMLVTSDSSPPLPGDLADIPWQTCGWRQMMHYRRVDGTTSLVEKARESFEQGNGDVIILELHEWFPLMTDRWRGLTRASPWSAACICSLDVHIALQPEDEEE